MFRLIVHTYVTHGRNVYVASFYSRVKFWKMFLVCDPDDQYTDHISRLKQISISRIYLYEDMYVKISTMSFC